MVQSILRDARMNGMGAETTEVSIESINLAQRFFATEVGMGFLCNEVNVGGVLEGFRTREKWRQRIEPAAWFQYSINLIHQINEWISNVAVFEHADSGHMLQKIKCRDRGEVAIVEGEFLCEQIGLPILESIGDVVGCNRPDVDAIKFFATIRVSWKFAAGQVQMPIAVHSDRLIMSWRHVITGRRHRAVPDNVWHSTQ